MRNILMRPTLAFGLASLISMSTAYAGGQIVTIPYSPIPYLSDESSSIRATVAALDQCPGGTTPAFIKLAHALTDKGSPARLFKHPISLSIPYAVYGGMDSEGEAIPGPTHQFQFYTEFKSIDCTGITFEQTFSVPGCSQTHRIQIPSDPHGMRFVETVVGDPNWQELELFRDFADRFDTSYSSTPATVLYIENAGLTDELIATPERGHWQNDGIDNSCPPLTYSSKTSAMMIPFSSAQYQRVEALKTAINLYQYDLTELFSKDR